MPITDADIKKSEGYETLGPGYFAARRIAETIMRGADGEPLHAVADHCVEKIRQEVYRYCEDHLLSDLEINVQGHIVNLVDSTVQALLVGQPWAIERYAVSQRYQADEVRAAVAKHGGEPLLLARVADLEKEVARLKADLAYYRR
jgi:hypothetical protein